MVWVSSAEPTAAVCETKRAPACGLTVQVPLAAVQPEGGLALSASKEGLVRTLLP